MQVADKEPSSGRRGSSVQETDRRTLLSGHHLKGQGKGVPPFMAASRPSRERHRDEHRKMGLPLVGRSRPWRHRKSRERNKGDKEGELGAPPPQLAPDEAKRPK